MLVGPVQWDRHFRRASASTILSVLYGHPTLKSEQHHIVKAINDFGDRLSKAGLTGTHLVQFFPWLRHLPNRWVPSMRQRHRSLVEKSPKSLAKWKHEAEAWYKKDASMFEGLFQTAKANIV